PGSLAWSWEAPPRSGGSRLWERPFCVRAQRTIASFPKLSRCGDEEDLIFRLFGEPEKCVENRVPQSYLEASAKTNGWPCRRGAPRSYACPSPPGHSPPALRSLHRRIRFSVGSRRNCMQSAFLQAGKGRAGTHFTDPSFGGELHEVFLSHTAPSRLHLDRAF